MSVQREKKKSTIQVFELKSQFLKRNNFQMRHLIHHYYPYYSSSVDKAFTRFRKSLDTFERARKLDGALSK